MIAQTALEERIAALASPVAESMGLEIVRIRMMGGPRRATLQVMAERPDHTMDVDACASLSRELSAVFDVEDPIDAEYVLEVSSPGIDRPLTRASDFEVWSGHEARIDLKAPHEGRKRFKGQLLGLEDGKVKIAVPDSGTALLPLAEVSAAKLVLTDALIAATAPQRGPGH